MRYDHADEGVIARALASAESTLASLYSHYTFT
jgi:hypothetical protein